GRLDGDRGSIGGAIMCRRGASPTHTIRGHRRGVATRSCPSTTLQQISRSRDVSNSRERPTLEPELIITR
ncbi:hypothetical protein CSUI_007989, partial [Cystoisospora suis]